MDTSVFREFYQLLDSEKGGSEDPDFDRVLAQFLPVPRGRLLDIGCWDGSKTVQIGEAVQAAEIYGVDFNPNRLTEAKQRGIRARCADLNTGLPLAFPSDHFDVIYCGDVIEHIFSPDDLMDEITRLLKPNGYAVLTTPNLASWRNRLALLLGWQPFSSEVSTHARYGNPFAPRGLPSGHIRLFTPRALCEMTLACKLQTEHIVGLPLSSQENTIISRVSRWLDALIVPRWPTLANCILLRLRKPMG